MAKDKQTKRSNKTLPNEWSNIHKRIKKQNRKKHAEAVRAMKHQNLSLLQLFSLTLVVLLLVACGASTTPSVSAPSADTPASLTDTPVPPTDTPIPPTDTPIPPTDTPIPPTDTPVPPTDTPTPAPSQVKLGYIEDIPAVFVEAESYVFLHYRSKLHGFFSPFPSAF